MSWGLTGGTSLEFVATMRRQASGWTPVDDEWEHSGHPSGFSAHVFPHGDNSYHHWLVYSPSGKNVARGKAATPDEAMGAAEQTMSAPPRPYRYGPDDLEFGMYSSPTDPTGGSAGVWSKGDEHGPENWLSGITWGPDGTIGHVETQPDHQRKGLATQLFDYVKQNHRPDLQHSTTLTEDGKAWSQHEQGRTASRVIHLPTDEVMGYANPDNEWTKMHRQDQLRDSIAQHGIQHPIEIDHSGSHAVIGDGHHRGLAAQQLGLATVPVKLTHDQWVNGDSPYAEIGAGLRQHLGLQ